jgi:tetratricopeptide (TPR) repeat protein/predicted Ser/Thr protein kinase
VADPKDRDGRVDPSALSRAPTDPDPALGDTPRTLDLDLPEAQIGVYRVLGRLGKGGMGDVLLAFDARLHRHVAIKRLHGDALVTPQARERLRREAAAAATLNHSAIVQIYDILTEASGEAIVMEYVEGRTLDEMLASGPLPARQAITIGRQIAEGLAAAHAKDLIHRDLKTQNVIVTPAGQVKILDFGLAKRLGSSAPEEGLTREGALLGTRRAMSPEQARGQSLDPRSDLFSLGVLLYEICTGRSPFKGDSAQPTLQRVIAEPPAALRDLNPDLPVPLAALIHSLLEKDPQRRPASATAVAERLGAMEGGARSSRRRLLLIGTGALAAAALVVSLLWRGPAAARPIAVLVQAPQVTSSPLEDRSALAAFAVREATLHTLAGLEGIEPVGSDELPETALSPQAAARAVAANEIVLPTIACDGQWCRVSLRRQIAGAGNAIVSDSGPFDVPSEPEDSLALARAVDIQVRRAFPDHRPRSPGAPLAVRSSDYPRYLAMRRRMETGEVLANPEIDALEEITQSSPGLTEAYVLAAGAARRLRDRRRAEAILQSAQARHPDDPDVAYERFLLELETGQVADTEAALAELEKRAPGDIRVWRARARLFSRQGKFKEAAEVLGRLVRERPSWKNFWSIASVEIDLGDAKGARAHLDRLLELSPGNPRGLALMAELEWLMGDPMKAARIYQGLLEARVTRQNLTNLGWSLLLAGEYSSSADAYRKALELEPDHLNSRLNLGIALEGAGDTEAGRRLFREVLERAEQLERKGTLTVAQRLLKAQALARLGDPVSAVALTIQALGEGDRDVQAIFQAALIYALCGDNNNAIVHAREARKRLSPKWFAIPGFESLRSAPGYSELLTPA